MNTEKDLLISIFTKEDLKNPAIRTQIFISKANMNNNFFPLRKNTADMEDYLLFLEKEFRFIKGYYDYIKNGN